MIGVYKMKNEERLSKIKELLQHNDYLSVDNLAEMLNASPATIRRDLVKLESRDMITRLWGGAQLKAPDYGEGANFHDDNIMKFDRNLNHKIEIAKYAASLIRDNDTIYLDAGSTCYQVANFITAQNILVVTNGISNLPVLASKKIKTYVPHGYVNFSSANILGDDTGEKLKMMNFDKAFLGTTGFNDKAGYTTTDILDANIKKIVISRCDNVYICSDMCKYGIKKGFTFANINEAQLITNVSQLPPDFNDNIFIANK